MIKLNAIYDNGKVIFKEKKLPKIKREIQIFINDKMPNKKNSDFEKLEAYGMWKNRKDIIDSVEYSRKSRERIGRRYLI